MIIMAKRKENICGNVEEMQAILFGFESDDENDCLEAEMMYDSENDEEYVADPEEVRISVNFYWEFHNRNQHYIIIIIKIVSKKRCFLDSHHNRFRIFWVMWTTWKLSQQSIQDVGQVWGISMEDFYFKGIFF